VESNGWVTPLVAGWYGKMPCLGDFASRRLDQEFIAVWDAWLQRSIAASRDALGEGWLQTYLTSPMWRFVLAPGLCGASAWAGVLVPSVDKVGRYFPLTLGVEIQPSTDVLQIAFRSDAWFNELERIGLSALTVEFSPEELERLLAARPFPSPAAAGDHSESSVREIADWLSCKGSHDPRPLHLPALSSVPRAMSGAVGAVFSACARGRSFWWSPSEASGSTELHCCNGLPADQYFTVLLGGTPMADPVSADPLLALDQTTP
jgi:type VI secretion system protein ImpM